MSDEEPELDLNALMSADPLGLSDQDLDRIIAYQRKQRAIRESGGRTKKDNGGAGATVDIKALMNAVQKPAAPAPKSPAKTGFIRRL